MIQRSTSLYISALFFLCPMLSFSSLHANNMQVSTQVTELSQQFEPLMERIKKFEKTPTAKNESAIREELEYLRNKSLKAKKKAVKEEARSLYHQAMDAFQEVFPKVQKARSDKQKKNASMAKWNFRGRLAGKLIAIIACGVAAVIEFQKGTISQLQWVLIGWGLYIFIDTGFIGYLLGRRPKA